MRLLLVICKQHNGDVQLHSRTTVLDQDSERTQWAISRSAEQVFFYNLCGRVASVFTFSKKDLKLLNRRMKQQRKTTNNWPLGMFPRPLQTKMCTTGIRCTRTHAHTHTQRIQAHPSWRHSKIWQKVASYTTAIWNSEFWCSNVHPTCIGQLNLNKLARESTRTSLLWSVKGWKVLCRLKRALNLSMSSLLSSGLQSTLQCILPCSYC